MRGERPTHKKKHIDCRADGKRDPFCLSGYDYRGEIADIFFFFFPFILPLPPTPIWHPLLILLRLEAASGIIVFVNSGGVSFAVPSRKSFVSFLSSPSSPLSTCCG